MEVWRGAIAKIQQRIEGWQAKLLSRGGRLTLVNAVLSNLPLYLFSIFKAPKWVIARIEAIRRDFFWKGNAEAGGWDRLVSWGKVCRTKIEGGLGILNLSVMNEALLCKWWWKLLTSPDLQWNKLILDRYYARRTPLREGSSFRPDSQWWRDVLSCREIFKGGVSYTLGNGRLINFWMDRWCGDKALQSLCAELFGEVDRKSIKVCDCVAQNKWRWRKILRGARTRGPLGRDRVKELKVLVGDYTPRNGEDGVFWRWNDKGRFSVKSTYTFLIDGGLRDKLTFSIWELRLPTKVKIFIWTALLNRLLTTDNLLKRGWSGNSLCMLCGVEAETADHLFTGCVFSRFVIGMGDSLVGLQPIVGNVRGEWERRLDREGAAERNKSLSLLAASWWVLWKTRNRMIFKQSNTDPLVVVQRVWEELRRWSELDTEKAVQAAV